MNDNLNNQPNTIPNNDMGINQIPSGTLNNPSVGVQSVVTPSTPVAPVEPVVTPVESAIPVMPVVEPVVPAEPVLEAPAAPVYPTPEVMPVESTAPIVEPIAPVVPETPVVEPIVPVEPVAPVAPVEPVAPAVESAAPVIEPVAPVVESVAPVTPVESVATPVVEPVVPETPVAAPAAPVAPVETVAPASPMPSASVAPEASVTPSVVVKKSKVLPTIITVAIVALAIGAVAYYFINKPKNPSEGSSVVEGNNETENGNGSNNTVNISKKEVKYEYSEHFDNRDYTIEATVLASGNVLLKVKNNNDFNVDVHYQINYYDDKDTLIRESIDSNFAELGAKRTAYFEVDNFNQAWNIDYSKYVVTSGLMKVIQQAKHYEDSVKIVSTEKTDIRVVAKVKNESSDVISFANFAILYYDEQDNIIGINEKNIIDFNANEEKTLEFLLPIDQNYNNVDFKRYEVVVNTAS